MPSSEAATTAPMVAVPQAETEVDVGLSCLAEPGHFEIAVPSWLPGDGLSPVVQMGSEERTQLRGRKIGEFGAPFQDNSCEFAGGVSVDGHHSIQSFVG